MIEIARAHQFRVGAVDLKTIWGDVRTVIDKGAALLTPAAATPPKPVPVAPAAPSGTILGMPQGMVLLAGALAIGAGVVIWVMSKD